MTLLGSFLSGFWPKITDFTLKTLENDPLLGSFSVVLGGKTADF
jgi:fucose permease